MTRKLLVVAASGLVLAILLLSAAWAIGGHAILTAVHHGGWHFNDDDDDHDHGARSTRSLAFDPAVPLTVDAPADVHFVRGDHVAMTVSGEPGMISELRWEGGRLSLEGSHIFSHHPLDVEIVAPRLPPLTLAGAGEVSLKDLAQDELQLDVSGAGDFDASGKVKAVTVTSSGAGDVDLGKLDTTDAKVDVSGMGNIDLAATGRVDVSISGAGNVTLHRKPLDLTSRISGVGSVDQDY